MPNIIDDKPIQNATEDKIGREPLVRDVVRQIRAAGTSSGYVVALMGPWGYGKTSVLNLVAHELKSTGEVTVIPFNPWLFAGSSELTVQFLAEFSAQLKTALKDRVAGLCDLIQDYTALIAPITSAAATASGFAAPLVAMLNVLLAHRAAQKSRFETSAAKKKQQVEEAIKTLGRRIVVMIDDLDRLSEAEIKDVMRLVRLVGDFPNTTYVLAFDRDRVARALASEGGQAYLDKIVQAPYDLPVIEDQTLNAYLTTQIDEVLGRHKTGPFVREDWENVYFRGIFPLIKTPRDAKRLCNALQMALQDVGEEVAVVDLIAIEAVRLLLPEVFSQIKKHSALITDVSDRTGQTRESDEAQRFAEITGAAGDYMRPVTEIMRRLFPATRRFIDNTHYGAESLKRWRRERRLAHREILDFYLERGFPKGVLAPSKVQALFDALKGEQALGQLLDAMDPAQMESAIERLEDYEDVFTPEMAEPACFAVLSRANRLRTNRTHMWDFGAGIDVTRLVLRLLKKAGSPEQIAEVTSRILPRIESLTWRLELSDVVGHREHTGHKLVTAEAAARIERSLKDQIAQAPIDQLAAEPQLSYLLFFLKGGEAGDQARVSKLCQDDRIFCAVLKASVVRTFSQTIGDTAQKSKLQLQWKAMQNLIGAEDVKQRVLGIDPASLPADNDLKQAFDLALQHARGETKRDDVFAQTP